MPKPLVNQLPPEDTLFLELFDKVMLPSAKNKVCIEWQKIRSGQATVEEARSRIPRKGIGFARLKAEIEARKSGIGGGRHLTLKPKVGGDNRSAPVVSMAWTSWRHCTMLEVGRGERPRARREVEPVAVRMMGGSRRGREEVGADFSARNHRTLRCEKALGPRMIQLGAAHKIMVWVGYVGSDLGSAQYLIHGRTLCGLDMTMAGNGHAFGACASWDSITSRRRSRAPCAGQYPGSGPYEDSLALEYIGCALTLSLRPMTG